jgi:ketosteroid isomerase-like protein
MTDTNKSILEMANAAIAQGDNEGFLAFCTDDTEWKYVGDKTLQGKDAVRRYLEAAEEPPKFTVTDLIAEGDFVTAIGGITTKDEDGKIVHQSYCDVWRFRDGKMAELRAFVIKTES